MPYEYPFNTFPLANKVRILNPSANLDARYGPWSSLNTALSATDGVRELGLTVGVSSVATGVVEYWFKNGIQNSDLVLKTAGGASSEYLPLSGGTLTGIVSSTRFIILSGIRIPSLSGFSEIRNRDSLNSGFLFTAATANNANIQNILDISPNNFNFYTNDGETNFKLYSQRLSSITLENNTLSGIGSIQLNAYDTNINGNLKVQQSFKVENTFTGLEQPSGRRFRDGFGGETIDVNLQSHNSLFQGDGFSGWTKVYETIANTNLKVSPAINSELYAFNNTFQGVLYTANITTSAANYDVAFRQINFIATSETDAIFEVVWLIARYQDINNFYALRIGRSEGDCAIIKKVGGVFTTLKTFSLFDKDYQLFGGRQWILRVYNNYISVIFENVLITTVEDTSITQKGLVGIGAGNLGFRGNDSIPSFSWNNFTYQEFNGFEQNSYILNNNFGVGTKTPNEKLTVLGNISASNLIYDVRGNSNLWNTAYSTVCSLSSVWNQSSNVIGTVQNYLSTNNILISGLTVTNLISVASGGNSNLWSEVYSTVRQNSASTWNYQGTDVKGLTANYDNVATIVQTNSASWEESLQIVPTVTNYLSTNQVQVSALIAQEGIHDAGYFWKQYQAPNSNNWTSITYGNGLFVAIANSNTVTPNKIMTSSDGINWTLRTVPIENNWVSITYGNGLFVAVADSGNSQKVLVSSDAINWTTPTLPVTAQTRSWQSVAYGNGLFVAVANDLTLTTKVMVSRNGTTWTPMGDPLLQDVRWSCVTYGDGKFLAISPIRIMYSTDGFQWIPAFSDPTTTWNYGVYGNGIFLITSTDNRVWTAKADLDGGIVNLFNNSNFSNSRVYYSQGLFFIISNTGLWVSRDIINWSRVSSITTIRDIFYGNGLFVSIANSVANDLNILVSGKQKLNNDFIFNPQYGNLTLYGNLSVNGLIHDLSGNSRLWTEVYSRVAANSSVWNGGGTSTASLYNTVNTLSSNWSSVFSTACSFSANWSSVFSTVCSFSSNWNLPYDSQLNTTSTNAVQNSAVATRIQNIENSLNLIVDPPTYNAPIATLSNFSPSLVEVGELIVQNITVNWTQNDAGSVTNPFFVLTRNGFLVNQSINPFIYSVSERAILGTTNYQNTVTFSDGPIKNNILGLPDTRGRILSGNVSQTRSYEGKYKQFFGSVSAVPTNLRTLTGNNFSETTQGNQFSFFAHQTRNILVIPSNRKLSFAQTQNYQDVTSEFTSNLSAILLPDANNVSRNYKRYVQTTAVPLNLRIDFTITAE